MSSTPYRDRTEEQKERHRKNTQRWREANKQKIVEYNAVYREEHPGINFKHAKVYRERHKEEIVERDKTYRTKRPRKREEEAKASKRQYIKIKQGAMGLLGGKCCRCGCDDIRCLQIDHIIPVRGNRSVYGVTLYRSVTRGNTENLQLLCANCHAIKTYEDGNKEE